MYIVVLSFDYEQLTWNQILDLVSKMPASWILCVMHRIKAAGQNFNYIKHTLNFVYRVECTY